MTATNHPGNKKTVKVEVELPEKWVKMISAIQEWEDKPVDLGEFIRGAVKGDLRGVIESMDGSPVSDEA
ncbi:MAG TPA: hypothetical protein PKM50_04430 [Methanoregula sp.]|nr:hypothetical protein [Methanoregula sp.]